ncbi:hypothetical protein B296_00049627 [Ensete ventricosum]|uniref:Uncharacterized protein n=1 Tax=Ensete ventricosum TaxID=4639 RepID=A0A426YPW4_ENSVE|nr:hypothetical protein B296_00049627 [Ensete ventricosum]
MSHPSTVANLTKPKHGSDFLRFSLLSIPLSQISVLQPQKAPAQHQNGFRSGKIGRILLPIRLIFSSSKDIGLPSPCMGFSPGGTPQRCRKLPLFSRTGAVNPWRRQFLAQGP